MDRLINIINGLASQVKPQLARLGLPAEDWVVYAGMAVAAVAVLLILRMLLRKVSGGRGAGGTRRNLVDHDRQLSERGVEHWKRPFELLADRSGWVNLSEPYRWELVARLENSQATIDFVKFIERAGLVKALIKVDRNHQSDDSMAATAAAILRFGERKKKFAEDALSFAMKIEPKKPEILIYAANDHFTAKRYKKALPLLEAGIALCQQRIETLQNWPEQDPKARHRLGELEKLAQDSAGLYQSCLERS